MFITGDSVIGDLLEHDPKIEDVLLNHGMHCPGCPAARGETLAEACEVHGLDLDALLAAISKISGTR